MELRPAEDARGIVFSRGDIAGSPCASAIIENVSSTVRGTNIAKGRCEVFTVEHVLSALFACGVHDADIRMDGPEPPIMDGSSLDFARGILATGLRSYDEPAPPELSLAAPVEYSDGAVRYRAEPAPELEYSFVYETLHPLVGTQRAGIKLSPQTYLDEIAPARTFGFDFEIDALRKAGLARGGSEKNAVIITKSGILADGGLRFADEFARHKVLDMIGDFSLLMPRVARMKISSVRGGHAHNVKCAGKIMEALNL
jgi:UDP-3-O-[3-hydroxymyristoyl] N-acetylglucosamine deacetylase